MDRRSFLTTGALAAASIGAASAASAASGLVPSGGRDTSIKGPFLDLSTPDGNREAWARLLANTDMKSTKYGYAYGKVKGVRPGEAVRDLFGFTMMSCAKLLPLEGGGGYRKVLREIGFYTDLETGQIMTEWKNPYLNETVKVIPIANDPFNHTITSFRPSPPAYGGLNKADKPPQIPLLLDWRRDGNSLQMYSDINLFYPSALQPDKWPRETPGVFSQVTETFLYFIDWDKMQDPKQTGLEYEGVWSRITPWMPWMLMGPTPGNMVYYTFMGSSNTIEAIDPMLVDYVRRTDPKYLKAPETWVDPSLSSLEWYARERQPVAVPAGQPVPRAPDPELPAWYKAMQAGKPKA